MASEQMGMPAAAPSSEEMAVFDQMRQNISPKEFSDEMLAGASQVDPQAVSEFRQELDGLDMPPEVLDALNDLVDEILANPGRYDEIRQNYIGQGIPEDFLPEQFDPQFFAALNMAIDQMIGAPAGPQAFAKGGIAELKPIAKAIAGYGRNGDTMLAHITPAEARMLKRRGGSGTINPKTGLPEFFLGKLFKGVGKALKSVGNAVKKFVNSSVGRVVSTVALGFFLGPAAASALGVSSAAGVAAVSGFVGSAGSTLLGGGSLRDALKAGAVGGITAGAGAGLMGGSEAFTSGSYTGPTTVSGQFERATSAFSPTPLQQAAAAPLPPAGGTAAPLGVQTTGAAPGAAPVPEVGSAFGPDNIDIGGGQNFAMQGSRAAPSMLDQAKDFYNRNISPSGIQAEGAKNALSQVKQQFPGVTTEQIINAPASSVLGKAYQSAMPGVIGTYGPMAAVGIGALGAMGGFEAKPAPDTPESKMMRDRLQREEQMMRDNPGMFTPTGMERFGAVYNDKGQIIKWNPWSPESAGAFDQYRSPLRFPMFAPPPPPPLPVGAGMGGAGGRGYAKGGLASLAGGGMPGYAEGGDVVGQLFKNIYGRAPEAWELENVKGMSAQDVARTLTASKEAWDAKNAPAAPKDTSGFVPGPASVDGYNGFSSRDKYDQAVLSKAEEDAAKRAALEAYQVTGTSGYGDFYTRAQADPSLLKKFHGESDADALLRLKYNVMDAEQRMARRAAMQRDDAGGGGGGGGTPPPSGPPTFPPTNPPPVAPPPPPIPPIPTPTVPTPPGQIPWNLMPDFQRYVEATQGSPIRPTFSVLGNYVQGPQDPFGAGKRTPIYSQMGAPAAAPGGASSMAQDSSINLPQYMFAPPPVTQQPTQQSNPATWFGETPAPNPSGAVHVSNPGSNPVFTGGTPGSNVVNTIGNTTGSNPVFTGGTPGNSVVDAIGNSTGNTLEDVAPLAPSRPLSYTMQSLSPINTTYQDLTDFIMPEAVISRAHGGIAALAAGGYPRRTGQIDGPGTATSDSIPAMLSDGEFVMTAKAVRGAGNGSRREGAKKMYALMHRLEKNAARG